MVYIEEIAETKVPPKRIWQAWNDAYKRGAGVSSKSGVKEGATGQMTSQGKSVAFEIVDVKKNESFTTLWKSFLVKFFFTYKVEPRDKGSTIRCTVKVKGPLGFVVAPFLKKKIRANVHKFLEEFVFQVEQMPKVMFR